MIFFTLYSRSYCHLCDDMRVALEQLVHDISHQTLILDVDQDPELLKLYDELVPVLVARKSPDGTTQQQLCHYFLDADKVKAFCDE
jgi:hypothetical protein